MPQVTSFKDCCGAAILYGFGNSVTTYHANQSDSELDAWLAKTEKFQRDGLKMGVLILTLNDAQVAKQGDVFRKRGYKFSEPMWHPKHKTRLYLVWQPLQEDPGEEAYPSSKPGEATPFRYGSRSRPAFGSTTVEFDDHYL